MFQVLLKLIRFLYQSRYIHYGVIGVFGSGLNLGTTFVFTEWAHVYYMTSYILATLGTWIIMFFLHSYITFRGHQKENQHARFLKFISVYGTAFAINSSLVYLLTEKAHLYYLLSIIIVTLCLSVGTFLVNKRRVFRKRVHADV